MQVLSKSYRGVSLLVALNGDRLVMTGTLALALWLGALIVGMISAAG